jgi:hypothetical protein
MYLDGSYITAQEKPNDYDALWDPSGVNNQIDPDILKDLETRKAKYSGDVFIHAPELGGFPYFRYFQLDQHDNRKGMIKINLRKPL